MTIGVIFDVDGVLIDSYEPHMESWRLLAREHSADVSDERLTAVFGRTSREIIEALFDVHDTETVQRMDDRKEVLYRELISDGVPEMPGARAAVCRLHEAGFAIALGSSAPPENVQLVREGLRLDEMLSGCVTGTDVKHGKPDPQVFLLAAEQIRIEPRRCVVIEDAPAGIEAAHRAGMKAVGLIHPFDPTRVDGADRRIRHLDEIAPAFIRSLV